MSAYKDFVKGKEYLDNGKLIDAKHYLKRAKKKEPKRLSIREALARTCFMNGDFEEARKEFQFIVNMNPADDYAHFGLGLSLVRLGDRKKGVGQLKLACAMNPENKDYSNFLEIYSR